MKQIVIISGKGGTGKTSILASFAVLANDALLVDCDVDASNLHLLLSSELQNSEELIAGWEPKFDPDACVGCGKCEKYCRFDAVHVVDDKAHFDLFACEGCGLCSDVCPAKAITMREALVGESYLSKTRLGMLYHARLGIGGEMSGKLVASLRIKAEEYAKKNGVELILIDGPPGVGCPVIASMSGVDSAVIVVEPSLSGQHDMERVLDLCAHFKTPASVLINMVDINPEIAADIRRVAEKRGAMVIGEIPFDKSFTKAMMSGKTAVEFGSEALAAKLKAAWKQVLAR